MNFLWNQKDINGILAAPPCILILKSWFSSPSGSLLEELDTLTQPGKDLVDWDSWSMTNVSMEPLQGYCLETGMLGRGGQRHGGLIVSFYARPRTIANALICVYVGGRGGRSSDFAVEWWEPQCWSVPCLGGMLAFSSKCVVLGFNSSGNLQQLLGQTLAFMIPGHQAALFFCVYVLVIGNSRDLAVAQISQDNTARTNSPQSQCFAQGGNNGIKSGKYEKKIWNKNQINNVNKL